MKRTIRRHISAWLLLLAYVPSLVIASVHIHDCEPPTEFDCAMCASHVPHVAHLIPDDSALHDCALCLFLSLTYTAAPSASIDFLRPSTHVPYAPMCEAVFTRATGHVNLRGPPFVTNREM